MIVYVCASLLLIMTFDTMPAETHPAIRTSVIDGTDDKANWEIVGNRDKRSALVRFFKKGIRAAKFLLKDTAINPNIKFNIRESQKQGTLKTALQDFYSVNPAFVEKLKFPDGVTGRSGRIGDRTIILKNRGKDGRPTIEIMQTHKSDPLIDRITYTKNSPVANDQGYTYWDL